MAASSATVTRWQVGIWIRRVAVHQVAGYSTILWEDLDPRLNLLVGLNGVGKSTILQSIGMACQYLRGESRDKLLSRSYLKSRIELTVVIDGAATSHGFDFFKINRGKREPIHDLQVLQYVENRQPQNTVGRHPQQARQHPMERYPKTVSGLAHLLQGSADEQDIVRKVLALCAEILPSSSWEYVARALAGNRQSAMRPCSCGEFDLLAFGLDLVQADPARDTIVIVDNPDLYLHPAGQEALLINIRSKFPDAQLLCATHSLKLLCTPQQKGVFWLSRDRATEDGQVHVVSTRQLRGAAEEAFYELYGTDVSSATLNLLRGLESLEYYRFLLECALAPEEVSRKSPHQDPQVQIAMEDIDLLRGPASIMEIGPGTGDVVEALRRLRKGHPGLRYYGVIPSTSTPNELLVQRLDGAKGEGMLAPDSTIVDRLSDCPGDCKAVYILNVFHELPLSDLAQTLAEVVTRHLSPEVGSRVIVVEQVMLQKGEVDFIMWTGEDYAALLEGIPGLRVEVAPGGRADGPPIEATIISREDAERASLDARMVQDRLHGYLPTKRQQLLQRISSLRAIGKQGPRLAETIRERQLAFCVAQVVTIDLLLEERSEETASLTKKET